MESDTGIDDISLDQRQWPRERYKIPQLLLWAGAALRDAEVLDVSVGGIAILVRDGTVVQVGQEVQLTHGGHCVPVIVKHVDQRDDGKYCLGLDWGASEVTAESILNLLSHQHR